MWLCGWSQAALPPRCLPITAAPLREPQQTRRWLALPSAPLPNPASSRACTPPHTRIRSRSTAREPPSSRLLCLLLPLCCRLKGVHPINAGLWGRSANITVKANHGNWGKVGARHFVFWLPSLCCTGGSSQRSCLRSWRASGEARSGK